MFGCFACKKNVCREHGMSDDCRSAFDHLVDRIKKWSGGLSKEARGDASQLLMFESRGLATPLAAIALLVNCCGSPKMQFFADCVPCSADGEVGQERVFQPPPIPFVVSIMQRVSRLGRLGFRASRKSIAISTSDEVVQVILSRHDDWSLHVLDYEMCDGRSLLLMQVVGKQPEVMVLQARPRPQTARLSADHWLLHDLPDNPFSYGTGIGTASAKPGIGSAGVGRDDADMADRMSEDEDFRSDHEDSEGEFAGLPWDVIRDLAEGLAEDAIPSDLPSGAGEGADEPPFSEDELIMGAVVAAAVEEEAEASGGPSSSSSGPDRTTIIAAASQDGLGYVKCTLAPWSSVPMVGRITAWPPGKAPDKQSVAIRCYMHPACSVTRKRSAYSDDQLLNWLFSNSPLEPGATTVAKRAAKDQHMQLAEVSLPKANRASSSAAASSSLAPAAPAV
jgi:hypothetical protein